MNVWLNVGVIFLFITVLAIVWKRAKQRQQDLHQVKKSILVKDFELQTQSTELQAKDKKIGQQQTKITKMTAAIVY